MCHTGFAVGDLSGRNFGLFIAYLIPGFLALWGLGCLSSPLHVWLLGAGESGPSVVALLYVVIASVASGMSVSALRWAVVDRVHHATGIRRPRLDFRRLDEKLQAFERLTEYHYQYYQFYANSLVALSFAYPMWRRSSHEGGLGTDVLFLIVQAAFAAGSRDALRQFYHRASQLLGEVESEVSHDERHGQAQALRNNTDAEGPDTAA